MQERTKSIVIILLMGLLISCTENPFFKEKIKFNERQTISGNVGLESSDDNSGIVVYLESFELFTKTDSDGNFTLIIPAAHLQPGDGLTGLYKIYFYVANYRIEFLTVLVSNGEFVFDIVDLNSQGEIKRKVVLKKLLDVSSKVTPVSINEDYDGDINVELTLNNRIDSVIVSTFIVKKKELGSVYLSSINQVHLIKLRNVSLKSFVISDQTIFRMEIDWGLEKEGIGAGNYDVIPYLQIYQEGVPDKLLKYIGVNSQSFHPDFLNLPFRRQTEQIVISLSDSMM